ncbi:MAG: hypothetical protein LBJ10_08135 [Clostridiales bacterium]|jgi:hypothetical protein|nr:hypothetical protein [Clostridiales bacterium]
MKDKMLHVPCLMLCALAFIDMDYSSLSALDAAVMALAALAAASCVAHMIASRKKA